MGVSIRYLQVFFKSKCNKTMTKKLNLKIQNYNLISTKINRPTTLGNQLLTHCSFFVIKIKFVAFHLTLSMLQKTLNLVQKWEGYGLFYVRGFMFNDTFVKIGSNFEIKLFFYCSVAFGFQRSLADC
jgi:hypothetical protein